MAPCQFLDVTLHWLVSGRLRDKTQQLICVQHQDAEHLTVAKGVALRLAWLETDFDPAAPALHLRNILRSLRQRPVRFVMKLD